MATQRTETPIGFRGTPILIEGLVPIPYQIILGGALVRVTLKGSSDKGTEALNVQTVPSGQSATLVRFSVAENTPSGTYGGDLYAGDAHFPITAEVEARQQVQISPTRLSLSGLPGSQLTIELTAVNSGNTGAEIAEAGGFGLFDVHGAERAIGETLRSDNEFGKELGERRVDRLFNQFAKEHGGLARVQFREGAGQLPPGAYRRLKALIRLPDGIQPGHTYSGTWSIGEVRLYVRVDVPVRIESKEVQ
jgi:hypothetical protein